MSSPLLDDLLRESAIAHGDPQRATQASSTSAPPASLEPAKLRAFCAERLPAYMIPESIKVRGALPRGSTGKVDKLGLREELSHV